MDSVLAASRRPGMTEGALPEPAPIEALDIVDCHHHFWDLSGRDYPWLCDPVPVHFRYGDYSSIRRNYLPADYRRDIGPYRVVKTVHEEAWWDRNRPVAETRWLDKVAAEHGWPNACVAAAWLDRADIEEVLAGHAESPLVRGIRNFPAAAPAPRDARRGAKGSMDDPQWRRGYALLRRYGFSFDLQTPWWHLDAAAELAADFPDTMMVIVHAGLPADRSEEGLAGWRRALEPVAAQPNVAIKVSGLGQPNRRWTLAEQGPVIRDAIAIFGPERAMFASNFPVDSIVGSFTTIYDGFRAAVAERPLAEQRMLFGGNATRIYRL
jgi:predicted TIM-barrel fold metal-dependent hydrolase